MMITRIVFALVLCPVAPFSICAGSERENASHAPQCGHWAIQRCCEILGVPLDTEDIMALMPFDERGHSMLTIVRTLETIGLSIEAKKTDFTQLRKGTFPVIVHLQPDHYVTVVRVDDQYVTLFDGNGRRRKHMAEEFKKQWSGRILRVSRRSEDPLLPAFLPANTATLPRVQFETLIVDRGEIQDEGQTVEYAFPFKNVGHGTLIVKQVKTTCACMESEKPEKPVAPMDQGVITLRYSVEKTLGSFSHEAYVQTNDPIFPVIRLTASGNTNRAVSILPKYLDLGRVVPGIPRSVLCAVEHSGDNPLEVQAIENVGHGVRVMYRKIDDYLGTQKLLVVRKNISRLELLFTYDSSVLGQRSTDIRIVTNIKGYERVRLPVMAFVVQPIELRPEVLAFSKDSLSKSVTAVSSSQKPFRIIRIDSAQLGLTGSFQPNPASETTITFVSTAPAHGQVCRDGSVEIEFEFVDTQEHLTANLPVCFWQ